MKLINVIMVLAAMVLMACENGQIPQDRPIDNPSEVNPDNNGNENGGEPVWQYDEFMGYDLPEGRRQEMDALLSMIDSQEGEINDELFEELLVSRVMTFSEQYLTDNTSWTSCYDWDGGEYCGTLMMMEDGTYYDHTHVGCAFVEFDAFLHEKGYKGSYYTTVWSYDAETHTLNSIHNPNSDHSIAMSAEVLYFDGEEAILVGHIAGVAIVGANNYNNYVTGIAHEMELYRFKFTDGRESFLEGYASPEEYNALKEEWEAMHPGYF